MSAEITNQTRTLRFSALVSEFSGQASARKKRWADRQEYLLTERRRALDAGKLKLYPGEIDTMMATMWTADHQFCLAPVLTIHERMRLKAALVANGYVEDKFTKKRKAM
jgi:hypothetical protein